MGSFKAIATCYHACNTNCKVVFSVACENMSIIYVIILAWCIIMTRCFNLNCPREGWINLLASKYYSWDSVSSLQRSPGNIYQKFQMQNKLLCYNSQSAQWYVCRCNKWQYVVTQCEFDPVAPLLTIMLAHFQSSDAQTFTFYSFYGNV